MYNYSFFQLSLETGMKHVPIGFSFPLEHENVAVGSCATFVNQLPLIKFVNRSDQITRIMSNNFSFEKRPRCSNTQATLSCLIDLGIWKKML